MDCKSILSINISNERTYEPSKHFGLKIEALADAYTNRNTEFAPIEASDYMSFEARGYVCIGAYDGSAKPNNPHYQQY